MQNGSGTDRDLHGRLAQAEADFGLEPLPAILDEIDGSDRCSADLGGQLHQAIEGGLGGGVEDAIAAQRR